MNDTELREIRDAYAREVEEHKKPPRKARRPVVFTWQDAQHMAARIDVDVNRRDGAAHVVAALTGVSLITARERVATAKTALVGTHTMWDIIMKAVSET